MLCLYVLTQIKKTVKDHKIIVLLNLFMNCNILKWSVTEDGGSCRFNLYI